jgi:hypothetical protein
MISQHFLAQALTVQHTDRLENQPRFQSMLAVAALIICNQTCHGKRIVFCLREIDDLSVGMSLKRRERRQKIDGFQNAGLALRITAHQHNNPPGNVNIQAGKVTEIGEREVFEVHGLQV